MSKKIDAFGALITAKHKMQKYFNFSDISNINQIFAAIILQITPEIE